MIDKISYRTYTSFCPKPKLVSFQGNNQIVDKIGETVVTGAIKTTMEVKNAVNPITQTCDWLNSVRRILEKHPEINCKELASSIEKAMNNVGYPL